MSSPAHDVPSRASSDGKHHEKQLDEARADPELVPTVVDRDAGLDPKAVRRALLRLDLIVLPTVGESDDARLPLTAQSPFTWSASSQGCTLTRAALVH